MFMIGFITTILFYCQTIASFFRYNLIGHKHYESLLNNLFSVNMNLGESLSSSLYALVCTQTLGGHLVLEAKI